MSMVAIKFNTILLNWKLILLYQRHETRPPSLSTILYLIHRSAPHRQTNVFHKNTVLARLTILIIDSCGRRKIDLGYGAVGPKHPIRISQMSKMYGI